jgi:cytosine/adenosine deaminase-related metal-dependent hydrolase
MADRTLIRAGHLITVDPSLGEIPGGEVLIEGRHIVAVGRDLPDEGARVVDAPDMIGLPGFVDTHRHTWQALIRNIGSDWTLAQYFAGVRGVLGGVFRPEDNHAGTLVGVLESLDSGITTLLDWSHNMNSPEHADAVVQAHRESGSRVVLAYGNSNDEWLPVSDKPHSRDVLRLRRQYFSSEEGLDGRITLAMAVRGPQFATLDVTEHDWKLAREAGCRITVHVGDGLWGLDKPLVQLDSRGLLGPDTTYVHCNSLHEDDFRLMADTGGTASIAPELEMHMGHGDVATGRLLAHGIRPSIGIDVVTSIGGDMFSAMRACLAAELAMANHQALEERRVLDPLPLMTTDVLEFATPPGCPGRGSRGPHRLADPGQGGGSHPRRHPGPQPDAHEQPPRRRRDVRPSRQRGLGVGRGQAVKADGRLLDVDLAAVRRLVDASRDRVFTAAGATIGVSGCPARTRRRRPHDHRRDPGHRAHGRCDGAALARAGTPLVLANRSPEKARRSRGLWEAPRVRSHGRRGGGRR